MAESGTVEAQVPKYLLTKFPNLRIVTVDPFEFALDKNIAHLGTNATVARREQVFRDMSIFGTRALVRD